VELLSTRTPSSYPALLDVVIFPLSFLTLVSPPIVLLQSHPSRHALMCSMRNSSKTFTHPTRHPIRVELPTNQQSNWRINPPHSNISLLPDPVFTPVPVYSQIHTLSVGSFGARHALILHRSILQRVIALEALGRLRKASDGPGWMKMEGMGGRLIETVMMEGGGKSRERRTRISARADKSRMEGGKVADSGDPGGIFKLCEYIFHFFHVVLTSFKFRTGNRLCTSYESLFLIPPSPFFPSCHTSHLSTMGPTFSQTQTITAVAAVVVAEAIGSAYHQIRFFLFFPPPPHCLCHLSAKKLDHMLKPLHSL
jgi:hypothetical protein